VTDDHRPGAGGEGRSKGRSRVDRADHVLSPYRGDVDPSDSTAPVQEEDREVLAIGEANERVEDARGGAGLSSTLSASFSGRAWTSRIS